MINFLKKTKDIILTIDGVIAYHNFFKKSCYWSKRKLTLYQYQKLKFLLIESDKNVPYYNKLFKSIGFDPFTDFKELDDLKKIPILRKTKARQVQNELINKKYINNSIKLRTSGSTGNPFQVYISRNAWVVEQAVVWRHWVWSGYNFRDKMAMVRSYVPINGQLIKKDFLKNIIYYSPFDLNDETIAFYLDNMIKEKIKIIRGYPSSILAIANFIDRTGYKFSRLKMILVASEVLTEKDRNIIENVFKAKVTNHYGLADLCVMMGNCEYHNGLHNYDDYGYLELHDTENPILKKVIGTNLHNLAMPLIRYETGDNAKISKKGCSCQKTLPTVHNIVGRRDNFILTPSGYKIPTVNFYTMFEHFLEIEQWQIVQNNIDKLLFIIKPSSNISVERIKHLKKNIFERVGSKINFEIDISGKFIQLHEGKINPFISQL